MIEEGSWLTSQLIVAITQIILEEHLGYEVVVNKVFSARGFYRRASLMDSDILPTDGEALNEWLRSGEQFSYVNVEAWPFEQEADMKKYQVQLEKVAPAGSIGFAGQEGLFVPKWMEHHPLSAQFWFSFDKNDSRSDMLMRQLNATTAPADRLSCAPSNTTCCCAPASVDCATWCPESLQGQAVPPPEIPLLPVFHVPGYAVGFVEELVQNNNFHAALQMEEDVPSIVGGIAATDDFKPFAFYWWTPSVLFTTGPYSRVFMPTTDCGIHHASEAGVGTWRCDFYGVQLTKVASADLRYQSPPAWSVLTSLEISNAGRNTTAPIDDLASTDIEGLLMYYTQVAESPDRAGATTQQVIDEVACAWVTQNQFRGAEWSSWAMRDIPWYAEVVEMPTLFLCATGMALIFVLLVVVYEKLILDTSWIARAKEACRKQKAEPSPSQDTAQTEEARKDETPVAADASETADSSVQFAHRHYTVCEAHRVAEVELVREGSLAKPITVTVVSSDLDALAGIDYTAVALDVTFEAGVNSVPLRVPITNNYIWEVDKTFVLVVQRPPRNEFSLGKVLETYITIEDKYTFPGPGLKPDSTPKLLLRKFLGVLYKTHCKNFWKAVACRTYIAFHNTILMTAIPAVLVDHVVQEKNKSDVPYRLVLILVPIILPSLFIVRWAERRFVDWNMVGPTEKWLRELIFRKFWKLSMESHFKEEQRLSTWLGGFLRVDEVVQAWTNLFQIAGNVATLIFGIVLSLHVVSGGFTQTLSIDMVFGMLVVFLSPPVVCYCVMRWGPSVRFRWLVDDVEKKYDTILAQVLWVQHNWPFVHESDPPLLGVSTLLLHFQDHNKRYQAAKKQLNLAGKDADWMSTYVASGQTILLIVYGVFALAEKHHFGQGRLSIGAFYAVFKIVGLLGSAMEKSIQEMNEFQNAAKVLKLIAGLLNDSNRKMDERASTSAKSLLRTQAMMQRLSTAVREVKDARSIKLSGVCFRYVERDVLQDISMEIPLGSSVALSGHPGAGKLTLLRLLSGNLVPDTGTVSRPESLKVVLLDGSTNFFRGASVLDNVLLGIPAHGVSMSDVNNLLEVLGIHDYHSMEETVEGYPVTKGLSTRGANRASALIGKSPSVESNSVIHRAVHAFDQAPGLKCKDHATKREQTLIQLARCILVDPDLMFINFLHMPADCRTDIIFALLNLWLRSPSLSAFMATVHTLACPEFTAAGAADRMRMIQKKCDEITAPREKCFVMLVSSGHIRETTRASPQPICTFFSHMIHLTNRSDCKISLNAEAPIVTI